MQKKDGQEDNPVRAALLEILEEAMKVDGARCGKIRVFDPATEQLVLYVQRGFSEDFTKSFGAIGRDGELASARAFRLGRRVTVPDVTRDPISQAVAPVAAQEGFRGMQSTPIVAPDGRVVGTLSTHFPRVHAPSIAAAIVLDYCASRAASVIVSRPPQRK